MTAVVSGDAYAIDRRSTARCCRSRSRFHASALRRFGIAAALLVGSSGVSRRAEDSISPADEPTMGRCGIGKAAGNGWRISMRPAPVRSSPFASGTRSVPAVKSSTSLCRHLCPQICLVADRGRPRPSHALMRSSAPSSRATNQWLAFSISAPQMSHEMAWRITELPHFHFISESGARETAPYKRMTAKSKSGARLRTCRNGKREPPKSRLAFHTSSLVRLLARSEVAFPGSRKVSPIVAVEIDGPELSVGLEVCGRVGQRVLAAQLFLDTLEAV